MFCGAILSSMDNGPWVDSLWAPALGDGDNFGFVDSYYLTLRFVALHNNVAGLEVTTMLLALTYDTFQTNYDNLRKGESMVLEIRHTILLGRLWRAFQWSHI